MPFAQLPGDLRMHYEDDDFTDPWKRSETVILLHGQAKSSRLWYAWVPLLAGDYRVIRPDNRGYGQSSVPPHGYIWSFDAFAEDLRQLMDHLGLDKVHLIGETAGGTIALVFAHRYPERVLTVTACQSAFKFVGDRYPRMIETVRDEGVAAYVRSESSDLGSTAHAEWYAGEQCKTDRHVLLETLTAFAGSDLTERLRQIAAPALILTGSEDAMRSDRGQELAELLPHGRLNRLPWAKRAHHAVPEEAVAAWRRFVEPVGL
jgi:pimeloyl-ACP methyl ester carboxylesterase